MAANGFFSLSVTWKSMAASSITKEVTPNITKGVHMTRLTVTRPAAGHGFLTNMAIDLALFGTGTRTNSFHKRRLLIENI